MTSRERGHRTLGAPTLNIFFKNVLKNFKEKLIRRGAPWLARWVYRGFSLKIYLHATKY